MRESREMLYFGTFIQMKIHLKPFQGKHLEILHYVFASFLFTALAELFSITKLTANFFSGLKPSKTRQKLS